MRRNDTPASKGQGTQYGSQLCHTICWKKHIIYCNDNWGEKYYIPNILMTCSQNSGPGFICIPRRTNILSPFANPVYLVQFIRLQGSRLNFFKVLSPINVWRTFEFRDYRNKKNLLKIYRGTCDIMMKRNYWGWWYMYIVINNYLLKSRSVFISSTLIRTCLAETQKGYTSCTIISYWSLSSTLLR